GGELRFLNVKQGSQHFSRKDIDQLTEYVKVYGAKGLAWVKVEEDSLAGPIAKFITEDEQKALLQRAKAENGDLLLFGADKAGIVFDSLGALRLKIGKELGLIDETKFNFLWLTDWLLHEYDDDAKRHTAAHHPFTLLMEIDLELLTTLYEKVHANAHDIVLNGYKLGGRSLRIYDLAIQDQMFEALGFTKEQAEEQFGFLLEALEYGTRSEERRVGKECRRRKRTEH